MSHESVVGGICLLRTCFKSSSNHHAKVIIHVLIVMKVTLKAMRVVTVMKTVMKMVLILNVTLKMIVEVKTNVSLHVVAVKRI